MKQTPIKHHFLPITYIKHFTNKSGRVWTCADNKKNPRQFYPSQICYQHDFYRMEVDGPFITPPFNDPYHIEKNAFKKEENNYNKIIDLLSKESSLPFKFENSTFKEFIGIIFNFKRRNPNFKKYLDVAYRKELESTSFKLSLKIGELGSLILGQNPYPYLKKLENPEYQNMGSKNMFLTLLKEESTAINDCLRYRTLILKVHRNTEFITTDNPGFVLHNDTVSSFGNFNSEFKFFFPLTSQLCLLIDSSSKFQKLSDEKIVFTIKADKDLVNFINKNQFTIKNSIAISSTKEALDLI